MLATMVFNFPVRFIRDLTTVLALVALLAGAVVLTAVAATALMPMIVACCVAVAPVVGCVALLIVFAWWFKP